MRLIIKEASKCGPFPSTITEETPQTAEFHCDVTSTHSKCRCTEETPQTAEFHCDVTSTQSKSKVAAQRKPCKQQNSTVTSQVHN